MSDSELHADRVRRALPVPVDIAGQWAWRLLAVIGVLAVAFYLIARFKEIVVAFLVAMLISALLVPFVKFLGRHHWPRWLAIVVSLVGTFAILGGLILLVETQVRAGLPSLETQSVQAYNSFKAYLNTSPLQIDGSQFDGYVNQIGAAVQSHSSQLFSGALTVGSSALHILTGALLTLFATIFILIDGAGVWRFVTRLFPRRARPAIDGAGHAGWLTLTTFVRVQLLVATVDAVGVGLFAFFLGLPLAIPIAIIVFLASFIPVVGAIATGIVAVAVALVFVGPVQALIMLGGVLLVHLLEAHVLQPLVMGSAVKVHPLAVVFAVAAGTLLAGIPGALFAVPTIAVVNVMVNFIASGQWRARTNANETEAAAQHGNAT
jgi:predicted PurR-regulated permease PerM